jgi:hypothetical protein
MQLIKQAYAQTQDWDVISTGCSENSVATIQGIGCLLANVLSVALTLIGLASFIMIIVGGFKYLAMGSNQQHAESAKKTITFAIIGIVVALSAFIVLNIVSSFTGLDSIMDFALPNSDTNWSQELNTGAPNRGPNPVNQ